MTDKKLNELVGKFSGEGCIDGSGNDINTKTGAEAFVMTTETT